MCHLLCQSVNVVELNQSHPDTSLPVTNVVSPLYDTSLIISIALFQVR